MTSEKNSSDKVMYEEIFEIYEGSTDIIYDPVKLECEDCIQESVELDYEEKKKEDENSFVASERRKSKINKNFLANKRKTSDSTQGLRKYKRKKDTTIVVDGKFIKENETSEKKKDPTEASILSDTENSSDEEDNIDDSSDTENEMVPGMKFSDLDNIFGGDMFLVKDPVSGIALNKGACYCLRESYIQAENATSTTMAARRLLDGVFTVEALSVCSLSGMPPRGKGKSAYADKSSIKPYLCPEAVNAIVDKTLQFQKMNHWYPKKDASRIKQAMARFPIGNKFDGLRKKRKQRCVYFLNIWKN